MGASNWPGLAIPKPEPRKRTKGRRVRNEARVKKSVRAQTVERDGHCLVATGQVAEKRHTTAGSGQLCEKHHDDYDAHKFDITTDDGVGMDGAIGIVRRAA